MAAWIMHRMAPATHRPAIALFVSADEANVDNTIPAGTPAATNKGAVPKYPLASASTPIRPRTRPPMAAITTGRVPRDRLYSCPVHDGATRDLLLPQRRQDTGPGPRRSHLRQARQRLFRQERYDRGTVQRWPKCGADLLAHTKKSYGGSAASQIGGYLAIADPKNGWTFAGSGCGPSQVAPNAPYGLAGMEALYVAAVGYYHANPHTALGATASDQACAEIDRMTDKGSDLDNYNTTSPSSGGQNGNGNYSDPSLPIIFGDNVTYTQDSLVAGTSQIALLPKSFEVSPAGNDTDFWAEVPGCGVATLADATVSNGWRAHIASAEPCTDSGLCRRHARQCGSRDQLGQLWERWRR